jgi:hypothetical protein
VTRPSRDVGGEQVDLRPGRAHQMIPAGALGRDQPTQRLRRIGRHRLEPASHVVRRVRILDGDPELAFDDVERRRGDRGEIVVGQGS